jgi:hypothetical protein
MEPEVLRQFFQTLLGGFTPIQGVARAADFVVTALGTPNMSVNVASGFALITGTNNSPVQGVYHVYNDATVNLVIAASNPTNPRVDVVCLTVRDAYYSGTNNDAILQVITGTPGGTPSVPAIPANSIPLAHIYVGANVTSITNSAINSTAGSGNPDTIAFVAPMIGPRLASAKLTANSASIVSAYPSITSIGLSCIVNVAASRRIRVTLSGMAQISASNVTASLGIYRDGTGTPVDQTNFSASGTAHIQAFIMDVEDTPPAGVHSYSVYGWVDSGGSFNTFSSAAAPTTMIVEDLGPV